MMKRLGSLGLLLGLLAACAGKNTVAGSDKTKAEQLDSSLPSWCQQICDKFRTCSASSGCNCDGDSCDCSQVSSDCESECEDEMARFTRNESCATVGESFKTCLNGLKCDDSTTDCRLADADDASCPEIQSRPPSDDGGGATASAGTTNSGTGGAPPTSGGPSTGGAAATGGTGTGGTGSNGPRVGCASAYGSAGAAGTGGVPPASAVTCEEGVEQCDDGHTYDWICVRGSQ
ncbi:MAG TPA: hypothetical protein VEQ59_23590, partial [Polyangiaceae bacterium]|nr:hypothetical protein [Polyangiaceae bacterium]